MAENESGTPETGAQAPSAESTGTGNQPDEVTLLRSRNAGLDAKVTELTKAEKAAKDEAATAAQKLADYEAGKVGADEALRAQLAEAKRETEAARREAQLARIEAKYPETFAVLGEDAAGLSDDKLAQNEARLKGGAESSDEAPTPRGNNPSRTGQTAAPKEETSADILARLKAMGVPPDWNGRPTVG